MNISKFPNSWADEFVLETSSIISGVRGNDRSRHVEALKNLDYKLSVLKTFEPYDKRTVSSFKMKKNYTSSVLAQEDSYISSIQCLPSGDVLFSTHNKRIAIYTARGGNKWGEKSSLGTANAVQGAQIGPNGKISYADNDGGLWTANQPAVHNNLWVSLPVKKLKNSVSRIQILPDERLAACTYNGDLAIIETKETGTWMESILASPGSPLRCMQVLPGNRVVVGDEAGRVRALTRDSEGIWEEVSVAGDGARINDLALTDNGKILAVNEAGWILTFDYSPSDGLKVSDCKFIGSTIKCLQLLPNNQFLVGTQGGAIRFFRMSESGEIISGDTLDGHRSAVTAMHVFKDGRIVSGSSDGEIRIWRGV